MGAMCGDCFDYVNSLLLREGANTPDGGSMAVQTHINECTYCTFSEVIDASASKVPQCDDFFEVYVEQLSERVSANREEPPSETTTTAAPIVVDSASSTAPMLGALAFVMASFLL